MLLSLQLNNLFDRCRAWRVPDICPLFWLCSALGLCHKAFLGAPKAATRTFHDSIALSLRDALFSGGFQPPVSGKDKFATRRDVCVESYHSPRVRATAPYLVESSPPTPASIRVIGIPGIATAELFFVFLFLTF